MVRNIQLDLYAVHTLILAYVTPMDMEGCIYHCEVADTPFHIQGTNYADIGSWCRFQRYTPFDGIYAATGIGDFVWQDNSSLR